MRFIWCMTLMWTLLLWTHQVYSMSVTVICLLRKEKMVFVTEIITKAFIYNYFSGIYKPHWHREEYPYVKKSENFSHQFTCCLHRLPSVVDWRRGQTAARSSMCLLLTCFLLSIQRCIFQAVRDVKCVSVQLNSIMKVYRINKMLSVWNVIG